jgi:hypothetical protein
MARSGNLEVVENPNRIAQKVRVVPGGNVDSLLERVEKAMQNLSGEFTAIYHEDVDRIGMHMSAALSDPEEMVPAVNAIRVSLHDLRGQAGTFGYDLVTRISDSACKFIDLSEGFGRTELVVLNMHVDALRAVKLKSVQGDGGTIGVELMAGLREVIVRHANGGLDESLLAEIIDTKHTTDT